MSPQEFNTWLATPPRRPLVMGVLNVTPDSFSDGGQFTAANQAIRHAEQMLADGADLIDIGGESTRPGAKPVPVEEQIRRIEPVVSAVAKLGTTISIDTTRAEVAAAALDAGATIVNDISAGRHFFPGMMDLVAARQCPLIVMHMRGNPQTMQNDPKYADVVSEVGRFLQRWPEQFVKRGAAADKILIDPGIGFGKTFDHNLQLLRNLDTFVATGRPVVIGVSRKAFIGTITNKPNPADRVFGTAAAVAWCVAKGAAIVRVHDVAEMRQVVDVISAISG